jgi:hypothetical protein
MENQSQPGKMMRPPLPHRPTSSRAAQKQCRAFGVFVLHFPDTALHPLTLPLRAPLHPPPESRVTLLEFSIIATTPSHPPPTTFSSITNCPNPTHASHLPSAGPLHRPPKNNVALLEFLFSTFVTRPSAPHAPSSPCGRPLHRPPENNVTLLEF